MVSNKLTSVRGFVGKHLDCARRNWYSAGAAATIGLMHMAPTLCSNAQQNQTMEGIMTKLLDIIFTIARYVGIVIVAIGIFNFVLAMKDENADGQSRGIKFVVVGIALVALKALMNPIISSL